MTKLEQNRGSYQLQNLQNDFILNPKLSYSKIAMTSNSKRLWCLKSNLIEQNPPHFEICLKLTVFKKLQQLQWSLDQKKFASFPVLEEFQKQNSN